MEVVSFVNRINRLSPLKHRLIALVAGLCLPLSFAPVYAYVFSFLSPLVLFVLWLNKSPRESFRTGFAFGFGFFVFGLSWVYIAIHVYGATPAWAAVIMTTLFAAYLAMFIAVQGWLGARLIQKYKLSPAIQLLFVFPLLWVLFEWLRGWFLTGMPWLHLGYAFPETVFSGYAPLLGVYGISLLVVFITGWFLYAFYQSEKKLRYYLLSAIAAVMVTGYGLSFIEWTQPKDKLIKVSVVQGNAEQITKWDADKIRLRMDTYANMTLQHLDSDAVVWPENAMTVFYHQIDRDYLLPLAKKAKQTDTDLIVGIPFMDKDRQHYYSSMMGFSASDKNTDNYSGVFHKVHLVPFGEYVPLAGLIRGMVKFFDLPMSSFSAGQADQPLLTLRGEPLATSICYEDSFGEELIRQLPKATLLLNGSNNAWYGDSLAPHQHLQIAQMRTLETGRMLIRATTNGISAFVDHRGKIVARAPQFEPYVLTYSVQPRSGATPYVRWGNGPVISFAFLLLIASVFYSNKVKNSPDDRQDNA